MADVPLALGFAAGMLAAFNPCGVALVPAYLAFFLGAAGGEGEPWRSGHAGPPPPARPVVPVAGAIRVGLAVTAGFVAVFGVAGLLVSSFSVGVQRVAPWVSVPVGLALVAMGVAVAAGWEPAVRLPRLAVGGRRRTLASMALYGASYATVSLSCTLPVFLAAVVTTFQDATLLSGLAVFVSYALGMGAVLTAMAVAMTVAGRSWAGAARRAAPVVARLGGVLLAVAGAYVTWYAVFEIRLLQGASGPAGPVEWVSRWSGRVSNALDRAGPAWVAAGAGAIVAGGAAVGRLTARRRREPARRRG